MVRFKKPSLEYTNWLDREFAKNIMLNNSQKAIELYCEHFKPDNLFYRRKAMLEDAGKYNPTELEKEFKKYRNYYKKIWKGEDLKDKTVFIFKYINGYGDYIMFSRYIPILAKMAGEVIIELDDNLIDLYKYNFPYCKVIKASQEEYSGKYDYTMHHDYFIRFQEDYESFPKPEGYLKANPELIKKYVTIFNTNKLKIGFYNDGPSFKNDDRHIKIEQMIPIFENKQCQFYSLNIDTPQPHIREIREQYNIIELQPYIKNAMDTAALMKNLDLVVSVDSFTIHLAGALGIKSYLFLKKNPCWRWFYDYYKSRMYNSIRILRETPYSSFDDNIQELSQYLKQDSISHFQCLSH